jgi:hypothetical protein
MIRKARAADAMFEQLVQHMNNALAVHVAEAQIKPELPAWLPLTN